MSSQGLSGNSRQINQGNEVSSLPDEHTYIQLTPSPKDKGIDYNDERSLETGPSWLTSGFNILQGMQVDFVHLVILEGSMSPSFPWCCSSLHHKATSPRSGPMDTNSDLSLAAPPHVFVCELRVRRGYVECTGNFQ